MRSILFLVTNIFLGVGAIFSYAYIPSVKTKIDQMVSSKANSGTFQTLEARYSAEAIMIANKQDLLQDGNHVFLDPLLKFVPYLLMEVKYNRSQDKTAEGVVLWGLCDGEMVISTNSWEKTHGFTDCIASNTTPQEFKIINALVSKGGTLSKESLAKVLQMENRQLDYSLESCRNKSLIVQNGNSYRLHLQNPKLQVIPETRLEHWLVTKGMKDALHVKKRFKSSQIEQIAKAAFGKDFAIRKKTEIYLPVHRISVQNPDGSLTTSHWNALNGKRLAQPYSIE